MKLNFNITQKLGINNLTIIFSVVSAAFYTIYVLNTSDRMSRKMINQLQPSVSLIDELSSDMKASLLLTKDWIVDPTNENSKSKLIDFQKKFILKREKLTLKVDEWASEDDKNQLIKALNFCDSTISTQKTIMDTLGNMMDYMNNASDADNIYINLEVINAITLKELENLHSNWNYKIQDIQTEMLLSFSFLQKILYGIILLTCVIGVLSYIVTYQNVIKPIDQLKSIILELSKGKQPIINIKESKDEIGEMVTFIKELVNGLHKTSDFSKKVGEGDLEIEYTPLSQDDILGNSLLLMRDNLKKVAKGEKERNWTVQGVAKFGVLLRENNHDLEILSKNLITNLVKYLDANQGGIFVIEEGGKGKEFLNLKGFYAFDRVRFSDNKIELGEGLVGQCWQERESIYLTDIPQDFMHVKSGLGGATPTSVLISPLIVNEQFFGVLEIASFTELDKYKIDFVEKLGESIALTIGNVVTNIKTQKLLIESKEKNEQMLAQEEEIRQTTEEMYATQEELERKLFTLNQSNADLLIKQKQFIETESELEKCITLNKELIKELEKGK